MYLAQIKERKKEHDENLGGDGRIISDTRV
jgi:hypothetical protein